MRVGVPDFLFRFSLTMSAFLRSFLTATTSVSVPGFAACAASDYPGRHSMSDQHRSSVSYNCPPSDRGRADMLFLQGRHLLVPRPSKRDMSTRWCLMPGHRRRQWTNIKSTPGRCLAFGGKASPGVTGSCVNSQTQIYILVTLSLKSRDDILAARGT